MPYHRVRLSVATDAINGPFSTCDAVAAVGYDMLLTLNKAGAIFWADHSKSRYYAYQEVSDIHKDNTTWFYELANPLDECSAQYGRVRIYRYDNLYVVMDSFSREVYAASTMRAAFEVAVMVVHYYPDERVVPDIELGYTAILPKPLPTQADIPAWEPHSMVRVYSDNDKAPIAIDRDVRMSVADAIDIITGAKPSTAFMAKLCSTFPQALIAAYGAPLVVYDKSSTAISVAQCLSSLAAVQSIYPNDGIATYIKNDTVGKYTVVGGWAYDMLAEHKDSMHKVWAIDLALAHSSSPEIAKAIAQPMLDSIKD